MGVVLSGASGRTYFNPPNLKPVPNFFANSACFSTPNGIAQGRVYDNATCTAQAVAAFNRAHQLTHEPAFVLPANWNQLSLAEQVFTALNLERLAMGYSAYVGMSPVLNNAAHQAALQMRDPYGVTGPAFPATYVDGIPRVGGSLAWLSTALMAVYAWLYDDGWGGKGTTMDANCPGAGSPLCWGHREEMLGAPAVGDPGVGTDCTNCVVGVGLAVHRGNLIIDAMVQRPARRVAMTFTWAQELALAKRAAAHTPTTTTTSPTSATTTTVVAGA